MCTDEKCPFKRDEEISTLAEELTDDESDKVAEIWVPGRQEQEWFEEGFKFALKAKGKTIHEHCCSDGDGYVFFIGTKKETLDKLKKTINARPYPLT